MIHIVFNEPDIAILQQAIEMDESLAGDIVQVKDDYAVGPVKDLFTAEAIATRKKWWQEVLTGGDYAGSADNETINDNKTVAALKERLDTTDEVLWIWAAQNKHDVSGYYWFMSQFKEYHGRLFILYLNNLPFFNEKGNIFYPNNIAEIPAKEFLKAKKLAREITLSEFEVDPDEWTKIANEDKGVRLLEGGKKLVQHDYDFYDGDLKKLITGDWQKGSRIIQQHLKIKETTGGAYLLWRLKQMLHQGIYDVQGKIANMKDFEVKRK
jgi:Domain of unknown function (DUF1835)/Protein of unknown function